MRALTAQEREDLLASVMTSMEASGFTVDRARSEELMDEALDGPELVYEAPEP